ncbi:FecR domain-containing protein [Alistipes sp. kh20]|uniref:FecR family protein n=1 Tax=Alistipes montrealensis TaxID=2834113 RepID=UPI001BCB2D57|nr:FecR domain-containing protein [Alistipes montrealensis]MBS4766486.1 FecR domain-containing protein [Alistipes montrealensis]
MNDNDYNLFTLEDFLSDDFFIASVKNPVRESISFWQDFVASDPPNISEYFVARRYVESSNEILPFITDQEISRLWDNIAAETGLNKPKRFLRRKYVLYPTVAAASVLLLFALWTAINNPPHGEIYEYACAKTDSAGSKETKLILSDAKTVVITDKEAEIRYDDSKITVSRSEIPKKESAKYNQLIIPKGKMSRLTLSDGTKVWVNANTRVVYPAEFIGKQREIYVDGEIFLDVVHDDRPFIVRTKGLNVEVMGTRFNVCAYDSQKLERIVLVEGSVRVADNAGRNKTVLEPEQMYEASEGGTRIEKVDVRKYASWIEGAYYFDKEKLETVARRLSDYYDVSIVCSERAGGFICSGKLDLKGNLDDVLQGLSLSMPVTCEHVGDNMYIIVLKDK